MNITNIKASSIVIACTQCGISAETPAASCTIMDEFTLSVPCPTSGCDRVTFIPRQPEIDPPELWAWDHNRAMNFAFDVALRNGALIHASVRANERGRLTAERAAAPKRRFPHEEWQRFVPGERIRSVSEEMDERTRTT